MTTEQTREQQAAQLFQRDTAKHQLTVLHNDGLYRHLRLAAPGTGSHWYEIVTWPGTLTIRGDMGAYTFSRTSDMLDFFRRSTHDGAPNLQYWAEKADAVDVHSGIHAYSEDALRQCITEDLDAWASEESEEFMAGLRAAVEEELTGDDASWVLVDEQQALEAVADFEYANGKDVPITFDTSEWDVRDFTHHYVWCCWAILFAVAAYDRVKAEVPAPVLAATAGV